MSDRGFSTSGAGRDNQTMVESLAGQGRTVDIQAIFVRAGCAAPTVGLPASQQPPTKTAKPRLHCRFTLLRPSLICTL